MVPPGAPPAVRPAAASFDARHAIGAVCRVITHGRGDAGGGDTSAPSADAVDAAGSRVARGSEEAAAEADVEATGLVGAVEVLATRLPGEAAPQRVAGRGRAAIERRAEEVRAAGVGAVTWAALFAGPSSPGDRSTIPARATQAAAVRPGGRRRPATRARRALPGGSAGPASLHRSCRVGASRGASSPAVSALPADSVLAREAGGREVPRSRWRGLAPRASTRAKRVSPRA